MPWNEQGKITASTLGSYLAQEELAQIIGVKISTPDWILIGHALSSESKLDSIWREPRNEVISYDTDNN